MIKVMIADDHKMVREGLKNLIEFDENISVIAEAGTGSECISKLCNILPDILLLDINMPEMNGIDVSSILVKKKRRPKILIFTVYKEIEYVIKAVDIGVEGYI